MMSSAPLLSFQNLRISFTGSNPETVAVNNLNAAIYPGEWVALVGESGSGKSVTALSALQLLPPATTRYEGNIMLHTDTGNPIPLLSLSRQELMQIRGKEIAMIFQEPMSSLNPLIPCGTQIAEAICQHKQIGKKQALEEAIRLCSQVQLPDPKNIIRKYPHELSGGQKQRIMIAMAISCDPALLICDEPTTALDPEVSASIINLIRNIQQERKMSVLFITHDLGLIENIADRIMVMYKGDLVETDKATNIFRHAQHPYTQALLACRPALYPRGTPLPVVKDFMEPRITPPPHTVVPHFESNAVKTATTFLEIKNLTVIHKRKSFFAPKAGNFTAVNDVSFSVLNGETVGLTGPSGCGKTTLGRAILNLITPEPGSEVLYKDVNLAALNKSSWLPYRRKFQLIFQDPYSSLNPSMTAGELISEPMTVHRIGTSPDERRKRTLQLLDSVQLPATAAGKYPHEFSGGQRQRISIARALALQPEFLVCDESVSALDVSVQAQVLNLLNELKAEFSLTLLFISHDMDVVRYFCDRILKMEQGKLVNAPL